MTETPNATTTLVSSVLNQSLAIQELIAVLSELLRVMRKYQINVDDETPLEIRKTMVVAEEVIKKCKEDFS